MNSCLYRFTVHSGFKNYDHDISQSDPMLIFDYDRDASAVEHDNYPNGREKGQWDI